MRATRLGWAAFFLVACVPYSPAEESGDKPARESLGSAESDGAGLGMVKVGERWMTIADACEHYASLDSVREYERLRDGARWNVADQLRLARWCEQHGLDDSAKFHYQLMLQLQPGNKQARKALGLREFNGMLLTADEIEAVQAAAQHRAEGLETWKPKLRELKRDLQSRDAKKRDAAVARLAAIDDSSALPALEALAPSLTAEAGAAAVTAISRFPTQEATDALARLAIGSNLREVRHSAAQALKTRSYFEFVPNLIGLMESPVEVHARMSNDVAPSFALTLFRRGPFADELIGFNEQTVVRGAVTREKTIRTRVQSPEQASGPTYLGETGYKIDSEGLSARRLDAATQAIAAAEAHNERVNSLNERIAETLSEVTERPADTDSATWYRWWYDYNEYPYPQDQPLYTDVARYSTQTFATKDVYMGEKTYVPPPTPYSCFLAGTPVTTWTGIRPIESIRIGDRVLSQDVETGEYSFQPVQATTFGPPTLMYKVQAGGVTFYPTAGHPLWVSDHGWKMVKELQPGDRLHTTRGEVVVDSIDEWGSSTTHNLVVAEKNNYFITDRQILAHDITLRRPSRNVLPGVPPAEVAAK